MQQKILACTSRHHEISKNNLPLCCPTPEMELWNAHPRVYLAINEKGYATCPYCGTRFTLKDETDKTMDTTND